MAAEPLATDRESGEQGAFAPETLARGTRLGRYELLVPIAVGGMARVWAARLHGQRGFTKLVAIKTVLPHLASDPEFERMLVDEARIASGVRHPNVCEIYDLGDERGVLYIAMEWVFGDSLAQVIKAGGVPAPMDPRVAARVVADAAAGLHAAHNLADEDGKPLDVVHRDVSPHNVLVSVDGNVKVTDFGVAKAIGASHEATRAGQLKGKVAYMSPEQAQGSAVDRRSDVFALGCVFYEATTGKRPFQGEGEHQVMQEIVKGAFVPPSRIVRGYPFDLERIVLRAMSAQPLHRFPSMEPLRLALEEWLAKSGSVVTQSNVATVVKERIGAEIDRRRERIRVATTAILAERGEDPAQVTPSGHAVRRSSDRSGIGSVPPPSPTPVATGRASYTALSEARTSPVAFPPVVALAPSAPSATQYVTAAALGVIAAAMLGGVGFWIWRSVQAPAPAPVAAVHPPVVVWQEPPPPAAPPTGTAAVAPAAPPPILFRVVPEKAVLVIDGEPLAASVRSIPRPAAGTSEKVVVRADGFDDETLTIDDTAPPSVDVWLTPALKKSAGAPGKTPEALPANPY